MNNSQLRMFIEKVSIDPKSGCWIWRGSLDRNGYGEFLVGNSAHRVAYTHWKGAVKKGKVIDHLCRTRNCVNPFHMKAVTSRDNTFAPGSRANAAINKIKTHCKYGHRLSGTNLHVRKNGTRQCKQCNRDRAREYQRKMAAKIVQAIEEEA